MLNNVPRVKSLNYINMVNNGNKIRTSSDQIRQEELEGTIKNIKLKILIDTGSQISLINQQIINDNYQELGKCTMNIKKIQVFTANNKKNSEIGKLYSGIIKINGEEMYVNLLLMANMNIDVIIGVDTLFQIEAKLSLKDRVLVVNKKKIQFFQTEEVHSKDKGLYCQLKICSEETDTQNQQFKTVIENITCPEDFKEQITQILKRYENVIDNTPIIANHYEHKIEIETDKKFVCKRYPIPHKYQEQVEQELMKMEKDGIIEKASTEYISPLVIVKKASGDLRLCLDARKINEISKKQYDCPQNIDVLITKI